MERLGEQDGSAEWRATDEMLARTVTVRVFTLESRHVARVMAAARAAGRVSDPRLAQIFDADDGAEPPFIVTGWPSGRCLADVLTAGPLILAVLAGGGWLAVREMTAPHRPSGARPAVAAQALTPVSATAFGPLGESDGDNPELARLAIDGSPATAWHTQWYATAAFGNLKPGTGLLLDMGRTVTITSAQSMLGAMTARISSCARVASPCWLTCSRSRAPRRRAAW